MFFIKIKQLPFYRFELSSDNWVGTFHLAIRLTIVYLCTQLDNVIATITPQVREFDQELVKRLILSVKVGRSSKLEIQFHSEIVVEQMVQEN